MCPHCGARDADLCQVGEILGKTTAQFKCNKCERHFHQTFANEHMLDVNDTEPTEKPNVPDEDSTA